MNSIQKTFMKRIRLWIAMPLIVLLLLASACAPGTQNETDGTREEAATQEPAQIQTPTGASSPPVRELPTVRVPELIEITPGEPGPPVNGEAPDSLLEDIFADLIERTGAARDEIVVLREQAVTWSDGSMGCPQPGVIYTQALVPGYWVVLQVGGVEYDYRASERGFFILCEGGGLPFDQPLDR
jgi:hypothetical protein